MGRVIELTMDRPVVRAPIPRRRFRLLDAMILVAATAVGCAISQGLGHLTEEEISWPWVYLEWQHYHRSPVRDQRELAECILMLGYLTMPVVLMWTLALIPIRLVGPRPRLRRLVHQPGFMVACASVMAIAYIAVQSVVEGLCCGWERALVVLTDPDFTFLPKPLGLAITVAWLMLLIGRRWRAEASWVDRLGRLLGVYWIAAGITLAVLYALVSMP